MTVLMIDVDYFKAYNDHYGHVSGDRVLTRIAEELKQSARRPGDFVFRYGGEEFCILCSGLDAAQAANFATGLCSRIADLAIEHRVSPPGCITVSIGSDQADSLSRLTPEQFNHAADKAPYRAKTQGRNRVERYLGQGQA